MAYEISADILDIATSMFKYPWLEYPERTKGEAGIQTGTESRWGLKRKALWLPLPDTGLVSSTNPQEGSGQATGHFDGSPQPSK